MTPKTFGPYQLVRQIAVGGMAEIFLARTAGIAGFHKYVALKMIHPNFSEDQQFIQMLIDEAKLTVQLQHINIAQTFDLGRVGDTYYITMEFVDGPDLYRVLREGSERELDVPLEVAAFVAKEVASGLHYAHRKRDMIGTPLGIVHRDVSPQNVLISHAGEVKLVDFGIAKASLRAKQTQAGVIKGKYYYMSPEQAWGEPLDHRTDVFSAGILLYEMLTGQMLYLEEDLHHLLEMVRRADISPPSRLRPDVPVQLEKITMRALQKKAQDRYQTAGELASDLERFLHGYAPVFTSSKVAQWITSVLGEPEPVAAPVEPEPKPKPEQQEQRYSTKRLTRDQLIQKRDEFADENSIIFNPAEADVAMAAERAAEEQARALRPSRPRSAQDATRAFEDPLPVRDIETPPPSFDDSVDLEAPSFGDDIEDRTVVSGPPGFGVETEETLAAEDLPEDQVPTGVANRPVDDDDFDSAPTLAPGKARVGSGRDRSSDVREETSSSPTRPGNSRAPTSQGGHDNWKPAPALDAGVRSPAVSELRKPRHSRRTPARGMPISSSEPGTDSALSQLLSGQKRTPHVDMSPGNPTDAARAPNVPLPVQPPHAQSPQPIPAQHSSQQIPAQHSSQPIPAQHSSQQIPVYSAPGLASGNPGAHSGPMGNPQLMGTQMRLSALELDELPDAYRLSKRKSGKWIWILVLILAAGAVAGGVLMFRSGGTTPEDVGGAAITIVSSPEGATVKVGDQTLRDPTPTEFRGAGIGETYLITVDLDGFKSWSKEYTVVESANTIVARLDPIGVRLMVNSVPEDAEVFLNGVSRGRTPLTLDDLDPKQAGTLELRKRGFRPIVRKLDWTSKRSREFTLELKE